MFKKVCFLLLISVFLESIGFSQVIGEKSAAKTIWVDSVYQKMTLDERIGQLFMVAAYSNKNKAHLNDLSLLIEQYHIGGLIFFQGGPGRQINVLNQLQPKAKIPLWIGMDAEWGLAMRLDSTMKFPKQMTLGAIENDSLVYAMGAEIARHSKAVGVHVNFAPVVDVNNNIANPVIGYRSFGENKKKVAAKGVAYMKGMQDNGVLANAKHFPGHGDTQYDSHKTLPQINHSKERLQEIELYPFKALIANGVSSMMVAHLNIPAYDATENLASTLSKPIVTDLLKKQMGFDGLIFTDALNMNGVANYYPPGETDLMAFQAGNDVLLFPMNVPKALNTIKSAIETEQLSKARLEESVKKILAAKYDVGLSEGYKPLNKAKAKTVLEDEKADILLSKLFEKSATLVKSKNNLVPIKILDTTNFASLSLRGRKNSRFQQYLSKYATFQHFHLAENADNPAIYTRLMDQLRSYETVVVGIHDLNNSPSRKFGLKNEDILFLKNLSENSNVILTVFGNAYSLKYLKDFEHLLLMYEDNQITQKLAPQIIFGAKAASGKLPVSISSELKEGTGLQTARLNRMGYGSPMEVNMNKTDLQKIDAIAREAIDSQATPGCQILIAKDGQIIFDKNYGFHTYQKEQLVTDESIYDLASITKVSATLQGIMLLYDRGLIDLDKKIATYLPELKGSNKKNMTLRNILTHQAGLYPYIPFWRQTNDFFSNYAEFYASSESDKFQNQLSSTLYGHEMLDDSVWQWVIESKLLKKPRRQKNYNYRYSDMGYYIMQKICERMFNLPLNVLLEENIYAPLGMTTTGFLPLCKFSQENIVPTENDITFRADLIQGWVHDQGAAMVGGVAGHAGLFSNAHDLAILMQMNLWDGAYGGTRYYAKGTLPYFTRKQYKNNRRGLGWDKPVNGDGPSPTSHYASPLTFGHTGFTGTAAWADPEHGLVFIFLSNRIHPDASNRKLISNNIRTRIMDVLYQSMLKNEEKSTAYLN